MKAEKRIFIAFLLNLFFSVFEFVGGVVTGSTAILSDALHDLGDSATIGVSYFLEKKSKQPPDEQFTYGYARFSILGSVITTAVLLVGSVLVICNAIHRMVRPVPIHYNGVILFAVVGVVLNVLAAYLTRGGEHANQKAVNLHMLEDVLGWIVVLIGAVIMRFTDISILDPIMSIGVAAFILIHAVKNLKTGMDLFLEKIPDEISLKELQEHLSGLDGVAGVHHIHIWSMDERNHCATMHIVTDADPHAVKERVREELKAHGIGHATLELEGKDEECHDPHCRMEHQSGGHHHHHHHHHH